MTISSKERICTVHSPLGDDALILRDLVAHEYISGLYEYDACFTSENLEIDFEELLGQHVSIELKLDDGDPRFFSGIVARFSQKEDPESNNVYVARLVPWLWLASQNANCRIFHDTSIPDVVEAVFKDLKFSDFDMQPTGQHDPLPYCVQYRESDFNFVSRLLERAGISYYFEHTKDRHVMVLTDAPSSTKDCPGQPSAIYASAEGDEEQAGRVLSWHAQRILRPGVHSHTDYNFTDPSFDLTAQKESADAVDSACQIEVYDYPGEYESLDQGEALAVRNVEIEEVATHSIHGGSTCPGLCPGYKFALEGHYRSSYDDTYLLTEVRHEIHQSHSGGGTTSSYDNDFVCVPHSVPYRPPLRAKKPFVRGLQPATVVSPDGKDIDVDEYGRVLVHFPWDRESDGASCRVRVSQNWAGAKWGGTFFPHVGQEVLVGFLEGDPDRPIVAGRVYNAENMPPLEPATATQSIIRDHGGNQIIMEGADGDQRISMYSPHGETKFNMGAPNSPDAGFSLETLLDQNVKIGGNVLDMIEGDEESTVQGSRKATVVGNEETTTVGEKKQSTKGQIIYLNADLKSSTTLGATQSTFVGGKLSTFHGYSHSITRGWKRTIDSASVVKEATDKSLTVKNNYEVDVLNIWKGEAGIKIQLKCGGSHIIMTPSKITLAADDIKIHSKSGKVDITASGDVAIKPGGKVNIPKGKLNDNNLKSS